MRTPYSDKLMLSMLAELRQKLDRIEEKLDREAEKREEFIAHHSSEHNKISADISALNIKSSIWGVAGGAIVLLVMLMIEFFKNYLLK